jgi:hypothetical protein
MTGPAPDQKPAAPRERRPVAMTPYAIAVALFAAFVVGGILANVVPLWLVAVLGLAVGAAVFIFVDRYPRLPGAGSSQPQEVPADSDISAPGHLRVGDIRRPATRRPGHGDDTPALGARTGPSRNAVARRWHLRVEPAGISRRLNRRSTPAPETGWCRVARPTRRWQTPAHRCRCPRRPAPASRSCARRCRPRRDRTTPACRPPDIAIPTGPERM